MLFVLDHSEEVDKILANEPWSFDRHLVILQKLDTAVPIHDMGLNTVSLWVQVHIISVNFLSRGVAEDLCDAMGVVDCNTSDAKVNKGSFF